MLNLDRIIQLVPLIPTNARTQIIRRRAWLEDVLLDRTWVYPADSRIFDLDPGIRRDERITKTAVIQSKFITL
jgi:hypothetical protein